MKLVLWVSRHEMTPEQKADLDRIMGESVELIVFRETVHDVGVLLPFIQRVQAVAAVLPPGLLQDLLGLVGEKPLLRAIARREPTGRTLVLPDGRTEPEFAFIHDGWEQILRIDIQTRRPCRKTENV